MSRRQFNAEEQRKEIFYRDRYTCICEDSIHANGTPQLAHRIPQKKENLRKYGADIIHHPLNMRAVCSLYCNGRVSVAQNKAGILKVLGNIMEQEQYHGDTRIAENVRKHITDLLDELR